MNNSSSVFYGLSVYGLSFTGVVIERVELRITQEYI